EVVGIALVQKMLRVIMLVPFLMLLSRCFFASAAGRAGAPSASHVPWFAVFFILVIALNSLDVVPQELVGAIHRIDLMLLATAMAALGFQTKAKAVRRAGLRPLLLALVLFAFLGAAGYAFNLLAQVWSMT